MEDRNGYMWIGTKHRGIFKTVRPLTSGKPMDFTRFPLNIRESWGSKIEGFFCLLEDTRGNIWFPCYSISVLVYYNSDKDTLHHYYKNENIKGSYPIKASYSILEDRTGNLWFGGFKGVAKMSPQKLNFKHISQNADIQQGLMHSIVGSVHEDQHGNLWIGNNAVLTRIDPNTNLIRHFKNYDAYGSYLNILSYVGKMLNDPSDPNALWFGMSIGGLNKLHVDTERIETLWPISIYDIYPSRQGFFWLATFNGVRKYDPVKGPLNFVLAEKSSIKCVYEDKNGTLWVGTFSDGLLKYNLKTGEEIWYTHDPQNPQSISWNAIEVIFESKKGEFWFGTGGGGLSRYNPSADNFSNFSAEHGLAHNKVCGILEDDQGCLWISTRNGLSKFNPVDRSFRNFHEGDGILSNHFIIDVGIRSKFSGNLFFGTTDGCVYFHPDSIKTNPHKPDVILTDFRIFNKRIKPGPDQPVKKAISFCDNLSLSHDQSIFSLEFAALEYTNPGKNKYAYMMEGVDPDWVYVDAKHNTATYTNLDPGRYTFRVKASNSDGVWNEEGTSLSITIMPPWYQTSLAYIL
jgi:ligand-binding sensor domain-containing protein